MVWHVVERARRARQLGRILVATDDRRVRDAVRDRGGEAVMTSADHRSGTDRVAEAARELVLRSRPAPSPVGEAAGGIPAEG